MLTSKKVCCNQENQTREREKGVIFGQTLYMFDHCLHELRPRPLGLSVFSMLAFKTIQKEHKNSLEGLVCVMLFLGGNF